MHYIKEIFMVVPVIKFRHCIRRLMVLKEVYDPNIFTYITAIVDPALVHSVKCSKFNFLHWQSIDPGCDSVFYDHLHVKVTKCTGWPSKVLSRWLSSSWSVGLFLDCLQCRYRCRYRNICRCMNICCNFLPFLWFWKYRSRSSIWFCQVDKIIWYFLNRIVLDIVSSFIGGRWSLKLSFFWFCRLAVVVPCLSDVGASDLQHTSGSPVHSGLISAILLHDPIWVGTALAHNCSWFPRCILSVLDPNSHTWSQLLWAAMVRQCYQTVV